MLLASDEAAAVSGSEMDSELVERAQRGDKGAYALIAGAIAIGFSRSRDALARPTGVGRAISTYTIPIEGRDEWLAAARRLA